jgi:thioredoxin domain-containing protein 5
MRTLLFVLAFFFALSFAADSDVVVLTTDSFSQTSSGIWLVEFYAPWCGHCKRLVPIWEELATTAKGKFNVAKVDCTVEKDVGTANGIRGFPTIKLFHDGKVSEFNGQRTVDAFVEFVEKETGSKLGVQKKAPAPEVKAEAAGSGNGDLVILTDATFGQKTASGTWLVKFYAPWCGHCKRLAPTWDELATQAKGRFNVAKVDCTVETGSCSDIRGYPTIKLFHDGQVIPYNGPRSIDAFSDFVREKTGGMETVGEEANAGAVEAVPEKKDASQVETEGDIVILTNDNFDAQTKDGVWFIKFYAPWCGHCKKMAPTWSQYATTVKDRQLPYKVAKVDCTVQRDVCQKHAIRGYPTLKLFKGGDAYDYNGSRDESAFLKYVDDYFTAWATPKQEL